ncbi:MAG: type I restriction endonuclease subunit R [Kiritimatiellae bacterium]|nr:type I restriction endonuclease subunit R [Kiritimatiellia bacterium]MDD5519490.1 type I restriction endonuclease subunit R [Kiritimatiellia bacterium]
MTSKFTESIVETACLEYFGSLGYQYLPGPDIASDGMFAKRSGYGDVLLRNRLKESLIKINPTIPSQAIDEAVKQISRTDSPTVVINNRTFHKLVTDGVDVQFRNKEGRIITDKVWLFDWKNLDNNDWLVVNQFTVVENHVKRRPDIVVFINGIPIATIELKNPADQNATVRSAYNQFQTYKAQIPSLFTYNELLVISDGYEAKLGGITSDWERFTPWRTIDGETIVPPEFPQMETLIKGVFQKQIILDLIRHFIVFEEDAGKVIKKISAYHQYHAVNKAVEETVRASSPKGDKRIGVIWHTQGSGKSLSMVFYASKIILHSKMENPTLVVITDRNDLDDQLFRTFSLSKDLLRQTPQQAENREHLRELLQVASGGVVFTTAQKFAPEKGEKTYPLLSDRRNIVVIADEAHRSQYDFIDGFARHIRDGLPKASFIGFTGTPIELADRNTRAVFGDHISVYDIEQAIQDNTTVPIYYEGRLAKIELEAKEKPKIDPDFEDITEQEEASQKSKLKRKWSRLEAMVGTEKRLGLIAKDIVDHFEARQEAMDGKAMIVCMSRRICVDLYDQIIKLRPKWDSQDFGKGAIKVVMTGSASDPERYAKHLMTGTVKKNIENRFKNPKDPLKIVIVRDMWLTGFDVPCLHTMYLDKPMQGHGLMQTIARVNRVFKDKPGGLIVDYLGIAEQLKEAVQNYTTSGGQGEPTHDQNEAVAVMKEKYEIVCGIFHDFEWNPFIVGNASKRLKTLSEAVEHVLKQDNGKERVLQHVRELSQAFALAVPHEEAIKIRDDVGFFQAVRAQLVKLGGGGGGKDDEKNVDLAIKQLVSRSVSSDEVIDIFKATGMDKPNISILSNEFLAEFEKMPHKNLAVAMLRKLLNDEIKTKARSNLIQSRLFSEMLEATIRQYQNRTLEAAEVIMELVKIAKDFNKALKRGDKLGLNEEEIAFYDALETNDSAVMELGDDVLKAIARDLVKAVRQSVTIDWTVKESVRAKIRSMVKRILRKYNYPPDKQEQATITVLEQAELLCGDWAEVA